MTKTINKRVFLVFIVFFTALSILGGAFLLDKPDLADIPPEYLLDSGLKNPNLKIAQPFPENNQIIYFDQPLQVDPAQSQSNWSLVQWNSEDNLHPDNATYDGEKTDPILGAGLMHMESNSTALTIYDNPDNTSYSNYVYELSCFGGISTPEGGKNLFLSTSLLQPFPVHQTLMVSLNYKILQLKAQGNPPENVGQFFLGFIFQCNNTGTEGQIDTIFIQPSIANTHNATSYIGGNPDVKTGVLGLPIPEGLQSESGECDEFSSTEFDLTRILDYALPLEFKWTEGSLEKSKIYSNTDPLDWYLTSIYLGLETQGDTAGIIQVTDLVIRYTDSNYYMNVRLYSVFLYVGLGGVGLSIIINWLRERACKNAPKEH